MIIENDVVGDNSWGVNFFDVDHDGFEDLFVASMAGLDSFMYMNDHDQSFTDVWPTLGLGTTNLRGSATADSERDGDVDLAVVNQNGPAQMWRNDSSAIGNWLQLRLFGTASNWAAIGAVIELDAGAFNLKRQIKGGSSGHGQDDVVVHFGLGAETAIDEIRILWPSGVVDVLANVGINRLISVVEGSTVQPVRVDTVSSYGNYRFSNGIDFTADQRYLAGSHGYTGGDNFLFPWDIADTTDDQLYQSVRGSAAMSYTFDNLPNGDYAVDLHFMEPYFGQPGVREFDVIVEGAVVLDNYDISLQAGGRRRALVETVFATLADNQLNIDFAVEVSNRALISAISVRQVAFSANSGGDAYFVDGTPDVLYGADQAAAAGELGYSGGRGYVFTNEVDNTTDDDLYRTMRAGRSFSYSVDGIPNGDYEIELFFSEPYLKPGRRQFDVSVEGVVLLEDFDISDVSGGRFKAHSEVLAATVSDGELNIDFDVTVGGKALVSALRVTKQVGAQRPAIEKGLPGLSALVE